MVFPKFAYYVLKKLFDIGLLLCFFIQYPVHLLKIEIHYAFIFTFFSKF